MRFFQKFENSFRAILPSPFSIALLITIFIFIISLFSSEGTDISEKSWNLITAWETELWQPNLLAFAVQMMLMLVLGNILALSKPINLFLEKLVRFCSSNAKAIFFCTCFTVIISLFNWGLGLIFGAVFARKIGEFASRENIAINYPFVAAAGYSGLMVWHGGISGSAPIKASESGHLKTLSEGILSDSYISKLPELISYGDTIFSTMNVFISLLLIVLFPLTFSWLSKFFPTKKPQLNANDTSQYESTGDQLLPAEKLDHSKWFGLTIGLLIVVFLVKKVTSLPFSQISSFQFINPNFINLSLLSLGLIFHGSISRFLDALKGAIGGASGILIQFPLYFGIMGIMKASGLIETISSSLVSMSNEVTFPLLSFFSAGLVNLFVPSGGGQWMVQGPILIKASMELGVPLSKTIMALSYGDQITNMLQPFWALPLLGITGLKAREILPYTLIAFLLGCVIFVLGLLLF